MTIALTDGRGELYQWDTGRTLTIDDATVTQVHFQNRAYGRTIDVDVKDGSAIIPDELLQKAGELRVYAFAGTAASGFTKVERVYNVVRRNKPNDYMYTPTEQKSLEGLQNQIGNLDDLETKAKDNLVAAINEANKSGGGEEIYYAELEGNYPSYTLSADTPLADIAKAYAAKKSIVCRCTIDAMTATLPLFAPIPKTNTWIFSGSGALGAQFASQTFTVAITPDGVEAEQRLIAAQTDLDTVTATVDEAVLYTEQALEEEQKQQARKNIGAVASQQNASDAGKVLTVGGDGTIIPRAVNSEVPKPWGYNRVIVTNQIAENEYNYTLKDYPRMTDFVGLDITSAKVGQIAKITAVDDDGEPTAWAAVDMPSTSGVTITGANGEITPYDNSIYQSIEAELAGAQNITLVYNNDKIKLQYWEKTGASSYALFFETTVISDAGTTRKTYEVDIAPSTSAISVHVDDPIDIDDIVSKVIDELPDGDEVSY